MLIRVTHAAEILGRSVKTLQRWGESGFFKPACRTTGNHRMYDKGVVEGFAKTLARTKRVHSTQKELLKQEFNVVYEEQSPETVNLYVWMLYKRAPEELRKQIFYMLTNS